MYMAYHLSCFFRIQRRAPVGKRRGARSVPIRSTFLPEFKRLKKNRARLRRGVNPRSEN